MPLQNRRQLSAAEVVHLRAELASRLASIGVETRPEVALRVLALVGEPSSTIRDFAKVIRTDAGFAARLLHIANSALFAQRKPVSSLDRACLLLGLERLKSMTLGFHLARAAGAARSSAIAREVWGQSLLRACLAAEVARRLAPQDVAEAFVIGLLCDAGLGLMPRLTGKDFDALWDQGSTPDRLYARELETLRFTHVDAIAALASRWKLPEILSLPLERHHVPPSWPLRHEPVHRLHAVAYIAGTIDLKPRVDANGAALPISGPVEGPAGLALERALGISPAQVGAIVRKAMDEYVAARELFAEFADSVSADENLLNSIQARALSTLDAVASAGLERELAHGQSRFVLGGARIEIERLENGLVRAYLHDDQGQRLVCHVFQPSVDGVNSLYDALGLSPRPDDDTQRLDAILRAA